MNTFWFTHRRLLLVLSLVMGIGVAVGVITMVTAGDRDAISQLRAIRTIPLFNSYPNLGWLDDISATCILVSDTKRGHVVYDWDGNEQWRVPFNDNYMSEPTGALSETNIQELAIDSWVSPDRSILGCALNGNDGGLASTCRLSPNGEFLGDINRRRDQLLITVWEQGKLFWKANLRISPQGPVTGKHLIRLLVGDDGRIVLYTPFPTPQPVALLSDGHIQPKADLKNTYTDFVAAYVRTFGGEPPKAPLRWQHQASAEQGSYLLAQSPYGRYHCIFTLLYESDESDTSVGRAKLSVEEYPGKEVAQLQLPSQRSAEDVYIYVPVPNEQPVTFYGIGGGSSAYFCPRQRRLLLKGDRLCILAY